METMPSKDPNLWAALLAALSSYDLRGINVVFYAAAVAFLRIWFDAQERKWQRIALEASLSGLLAKGADQAAVAMGYAHIDIAIGSAIGLIGVNNIRYWGRRWFAKKLDQQNG
jgi:lambda family phage holin